MLWWARITSHSKLLADSERNRRFSFLPDQRQRSFVASIVTQIDFESFDGRGQRLQVHFRAAEIEARVVVQVKLAGFFVDDQGPFLFAGQSPDAVLAFGEIERAH